MSLHLQRQTALSVHETETVDDTEGDLENVQAQRPRNRGTAKAQSLLSLLSRKVLRPKEKTERQPRERSRTNCVEAVATRGTC